MDSGVGLFAADLGCGSPALVAVPGGPGASHELFLPWLLPLAAQRRLLLLDPTGCGRSPLPDDPAALGLDGWVEDVETLRQRTGSERVVVLGHSSGGFVALEYALRHPDRLAGLVLVSTAPRSAVGAEDVVRMRAAMGEEVWPAFERMVTLQLADDAEFAAVAARVLTAELHSPTTERVAGLLEGVRFSLPALRRGLESLAGWSVEGRLDQLAVPTLVLAGRDDWYLPPAQSAVPFAAIPGVEIHVFDECGHVPFIDQPERFAAVVGDWLPRSGRGER